MAFSVPDLTYAFDALEPHIDARTMEIHHDKHHAAYVTKLNEALEGTEWTDKPIDEVLQSLDSIPEDKRMAVRNNGGGHANHTLFWASLAGSLVALVVRRFRVPYTVALVAVGEKSVLGRGSVVARPAEAPAAAFR